MNGIITIKEREVIETREVEKSYTYSELEELFGQNTIVYELIQRLRKLEENKELTEVEKSIEDNIRASYEEDYKNYYID